MASLGEICENIKMARESSLLSDYETSQVYYQGVLQQIQKLITSAEPARKPSWQRVSWNFLKYH